MMQLYYTRKFAAAHFLPSHPGKCRNLHGHTWKVEVWLEGDVDPKTGMVVDFGDVKHEIDLLDHTTLNAVLPVLFLPPTAENIAKYFMSELPKAFKVRVWENDHAWAEAYKAYDEEQPAYGFIKEADYDARI